MLKTTNTNKVLIIEKSGKIGPLSVKKDRTMTSGG
jgi:hypothetical protein